jgi:hypothetical protein
MSNKFILIIAEIVQVVHFIAANIIGDQVAGQCPRNEIYPTLSLIVSSCITIMIGFIVYRKIRAHKWRGIVWSLLVFMASIFAALILAFLAGGGISWCNWNF